VQPFSVLGHNGEVNTVAQLRAQMRMLGIPLTHDGSDSQDLNRLLEGLIFEHGLSLLEATEFALPPILGEVHRLPAHLQDLYVHYREAWGPYAQGPVALACRVGDEMVFALDALGLRPLWLIETAAEWIVSSEPGVVPIAELTADPRPLAPGEKIALVGGAGGAPRLLGAREVQEEVARRARARGVLPQAESRARLAGGLLPPDPGHQPAWREVPSAPPAPLERLLVAAGFLDGDLSQVQHLADTGKEPIGSLGWDGPIGALSPVPLPLADHLQETVAVVTNPAIDREREVEHFSTRVVLGRRPPIGGVEDRPPLRCELRIPVLLGGGRPGSDPGMSAEELRRVAFGHGTALLEDVRAAWGPECATIRLAHDPATGARGHAAALAAAAVAAVTAGAEVLVLEDVDAGPGEWVLDPHLAVAAADQALRAALAPDGTALRRRASLVLRAAGLRNVHDLMVALGFGADAVCPYLMVEQALAGSPEPADALPRLLDGLRTGAEKVLSTLGIHELRGYGRLVSAIGVAPELLEVLEIPGWCASPGRGLDHEGLDAGAERGRRIRAGEDRATRVKLPRMYPRLWKALGRMSGGEDAYEDFAAAVDDMEREHPAALRHLLLPQLAPPEGRVPAGAVDIGVGDHALPFVIASMSFGSQSETAFRAYAEAARVADMICLNGEGGEPPDMYGRYGGHRGVQVASGRFGVSSLLLNGAGWAEIKIGQGAKPGEGGHLPGSKVTAAIARARNTAVGGDLISPSNNHDLYSIEDLAQLIDELKTVNPDAKVIVKMPVVPGIGTISVGVAKAGADVVSLSGFDGGTGAARLHAIRRTGLPCEIGTVLAHHALVDAGIRDRVEIWADGGLRTALDVVRLACLGADRVAFGTPAMIAIGCTVCRGCQLDTCHLGIATQMDEREARERGVKRFIPRDLDLATERLVRYFAELGRGLRGLVGDMGQARLHDLVGRSDLLVQAAAHTRVDLDGLLTPAGPAGPGGRGPVHPAPPPHTPVAAVAALAREGLLVRAEDHQTAADRVLGTDLAGMLARGALAGLTAPGGTPPAVDLSFTDAAAGSGLAAFAMDGLTVRVLGGAQDGAGKCALGGELQVLRARNARGEWVGGHVGKSFAYGAQRGRLLVQGDADARCGIRLSGADIVLGGEPRAPLDDRRGSLGAGANCKGFAFEYMTGGRAVVLGDPGPWLCSGMTGGVVYTRVAPEWGLDGPAVRRRLSKAARVGIHLLDEADEEAVRELLGHYRRALAASGQRDAAGRLDPLIAEPAAHFLAIEPRAALTGGDKATE
jgi:glutamate synthase (NADPH/NADH) large chain